ncbi:CASP-like protein 1F1 [Mercurialis annua]|uniref:CASP-like protein 1F1 n=1 Tax=Mercurialis annua TaxID=3986 RepID=UPI00215EBD8C|nr:CASP-like protein 1F1 [Mercurialis annua]
MENYENKYPPNSPLKTKKIFFGAQIFLRVLTVGATLAAASIMVTNKQSISIGDFDMEAKYNYSSAFKFFVYANIIACVCSVLSLFFLCVVGRYSSNPGHIFFLFLHDLIMMLLLLAGCSAATAIGFLGKYGNTYSGWMPICDRFGKFCHRGTVSVMLAYLSVIFLLILTVSSANKSRQIHV